MLPSSQLLSKTLLCTLLMAQKGYLHLTKAFLRCWSSLRRSSGSVQTVLVLWVSVPMTLYFADRLWWLSHCKYWSVGVSLWYTVMESELSANGVTKVSRNGIAPFPWVPSTVNLIAGSMLLIWFRNASLWACCWMTYVSSTNLYHTWEGLITDLRAFLSKCSMYRLVTMGVTGEPIGATSTYA